MRERERCFSSSFLFPPFTSRVVLQVSGGGDTRDGGGGGGASFEHRTEEKQ